MSLADTFKEAMRLSARMKADGVSKEDRQVFLEKALKSGWPKGREEPWHYHCTNCSDTGWVEHVCTPQTPCGRPFRYHQRQSGDDFTGQGRCGAEHSYVTACFCDKGRQRATWVNGKSGPPDEDFKSATKSKPMKQLNRWDK